MYPWCSDRLCGSKHAQQNIFINFFYGGSSWLEFVAVADVNWSTYASWLDQALEELSDVDVPQYGHIVDKNVRRRAVATP